MEMNAKLPFRHNGAGGIFDAEDGAVALVSATGHDEKGCRILSKEDLTTADFIVGACNAHHKIVTAVQRLGSMEALARAGAIDDSSPLGIELLARTNFACDALAKAK